MALKIKKKIKNKNKVSNFGHSILHNSPFLKKKSWISSDKSSYIFGISHLFIFSFRELVSLLENYSFFFFFGLFKEQVLGSLICLYCFPILISTDFYRNSFFIISFLLLALDTLLFFLQFP